MRFNQTAIVLRKIRGVFGACWKGAATLLPAGHAAPVSPTGHGMLGTLGAFMAVLLMPLLALAVIALLLVLAPIEQTGATLLAEGAVISAPVKELFDKIQTAITAMREANDERLKQIEAKGSADPLLVAKVDRANADVTALQGELATVRTALKDMETVNARLVATNGRSAESREQEVLNTARFFSLVRGKRVENVSDEDIGAYRRYHAAFNAYIRRGEAAFADRDIRDALSTGAAPSGGFWLTPDSSGRIVKYLEDLSSMRQLATVSSIGTDTFEGYYDLDEGTSGWVGETDARPETATPRIDGKYSIQIHEQYANPKASQKQLDDSETDVEGWLEKKIADRMAKVENSAFVIGNGVNKPKGFLDYAAGTPARSSVAAYRKIRQLNSGAAGAFAAVNPGDKLIDLIQLLPSAVRAGASFAMNALTVAESRKLKDADGNYLFIPDFSKHPNGSILGYGINELSDMPDLGANSLSLAFANFKEAYEIKDHTVGTRVLRDPYTGKPFVQFYTTKRVGGDVVNFQAIVLMKFAV